MSLGGVIYNIQHRVIKGEDVGQQTHTANLNLFVYDVGSYRMIEHSFSDRQCVGWFEFRLPSNTCSG